MAETEETKHCKICDKHIEASKFRMHDIGCSRQNYKCKDCGQCVAKADKEEHEEEEHEDIICQYCDFKAIKFKYLDHDTKCTKKPKACEFCDKEIAFHDHKDHYMLCGSKTEKCATCGDFVKVMDKKKHLQQKICQQVLTRKKKEDDADEAKRLEEFNKRKAEDEARKLKQQQKKEAEDNERRRQQDKKQKDYDRNFGFEDDFRDEKSKAPKRNVSKNGPTARQPENSGRTQHPQINTRQQVGQPPKMAPMPASYLGNKNEEQKVPAKNGGVRSGQQPIYNSRSKQSAAPTSSGLRVPSRGAQNKYPTQPSVGARNQPPTQAAKVPSNIPSRPTGREQPPKSGGLGPSQPSRGQPKPQANKPVRASQPPQSKPEEDVGNALDDYDQMIFNQFMDENEDELMAQRLQDEAYGGGGNANANANNNDGGFGFGMDDVGANVRQADTQQVESLIADPLEEQRERRRRRRQQQEDEWDVPNTSSQQQQQPLHPQPPQVQRNQPPMGMDTQVNQAQQQFSGMQVDDTDQQLIAKAIEESLMNAHRNPVFNEEEELNRILEMSKNQT